jgi:4-amino-4-deoxy-L-arabinose transferase-like glycosyltransferase
MAPSGTVFAGMTRHIASAASAAAAIVVYLALGFHHLALPGLQYDEVADAVPAAELLRGERPSSEGTITLFGRAWPLMMRPHIGPTSTYVTLAAFALKGVSVATLRASQLALGGVTLLLFWVLARRWFDDGIAAIAVLLLATTPPFVWWSRAGLNWTLPLLPIAIGWLLALTRWARTRRPSALVVAAWLCGAGIATKILFVWLLPPLVLWACIVLRADGLRRAARTQPARAWLAAAAGFVLGLLPLLLHNVLASGATLRLLLANAHHTRLYGHDNSALVRNLAFVAWDFFRTMEGNTGGMPTPVGGGAGGVLLVGALVTLSVGCVRARARLRARADAAPSRDDDALRARLFLVLVVLMVVPASTVSISGIGATYLFILLPFAWLAIAVATFDVARALARRAVGAPAAATLAAAMASLGAACVAGQHVAANLAVHRYLAVTGGTAVWSDALYRLATTLDADYRDRHLVAMDWGIERPVTFLTAGRVRMREAFEYQAEPPATFAAACDALLADPASVYAFHASEYAVFRGRYELLARAAAAQHKRLRVLATFRQRDGRPNVLLYVAEPVPGA